MVIPSDYTTKCNSRVSTATDPVTPCCEISVNRAFLTLLWRPFQVLGQFVETLNHEGHKGPRSKLVTAKTFAILRVPGGS